jgi:hypothetical protein
MGNTSEIGVLVTIIIVLITASMVSTCANPNTGNRALSDDLEVFIIFISGIEKSINNSDSSKYIHALEIRKLGNDSRRGRS